MRAGRATNWAGNVRYSVPARHPATVAELQELVARSSRVRALGTGHSFNGIADTDGTLVATDRLPPVLDVDSAARTVLVSGNLRYGDVASHAHVHGLALRNLASLPHIGVAGACATGTHGSGRTNGGLATSVRELEMVTADGRIARLRRGEPDFDGAVVSLGALGVVTRLVLELVPAFEIRQCVYEQLPAEELAAHLDAVLDSAYSVSLFTTWRAASVDQVWVKHRVGDPGTPSGALPHRWFGARLASGPRHPIDGMPPAASTTQLGVAGPAHERLPHFRAEFTPSRGEELQSEFLLPRERTADALDALASLAARIAPLLYVCEIRTVAADELWLSPAHGRGSVAFHFTWKKDVPAVMGVLPAVERRLAPFAHRPHWGKLFTTPPALVRGRYPRLADFVALRGRYDPDAKFGNEFVNRYVSAQ